MDANKRQRYEKISIELTKLVGGKENIQGVAHCATRLRIVLKDNDLADLKAIEDVDLAKGVFVAGDQVQIIFGAGLVNDVYEVFAEHNNMKNMSLSDLKTVANKKMNPLQRIIKALSDVFVDIMPGILAAALIAQGGAVLAYLVRHRKNVKVRELCIPSFISVLFGITEPALFGINLRYRFPIIGGCIGGAFGGVVVYLTNLAALGFGTTVVPGIALADPAGNGYMNYVIAHGVAIAGGFLMTLILGKFMDQVTDEASSDKAVSTAQTTESETTVSKTTESETESTEISASQTTLVPQEEPFFSHAKGQLIPMEQVKDETFANKILGDGVAVIPEKGNVYAPTDGTILSVFDTKHAVCFASSCGTEILIHIGVDTVNLQGKFFETHVKDGDRVKQGQLLISFDKAQIEKAGYDTTIPMIFTDLADDRRLEPSVPGSVHSDTVAAVVYKI